MLGGGDAQAGNDNEIFGVPKASSGGLRLLQQSVHRLDVGVAATIKHAAHDTTAMWKQPLTKKSQFA